LPKPQRAWGACGAWGASGELVELGWEALRACGTCRGFGAWRVGGACGG